MNTNPFSLVQTGWFGLVVWFFFWCPTGFLHPGTPSTPTNPSVSFVFGGIPKQSKAPFRIIDQGEAPTRDRSQIAVVNGEL